MLTLETILDAQRQLIENDARPLANGYYVATTSSKDAEGLLANLRPRQLTHAAIPTVKPEDIGLDPRQWRVRAVAVVSQTIVCVAESLLN